MGPKDNHKQGMSCFEAKEYGLAFERWSRAAEAGLPEAMCDLGWMYSQGLGMSNPNLTKAFEWMLKSAECGYTRAQNNVGLYYKNGTGTEKNIEKAVHWLGEAEKANYSKLARKTLIEARKELAALDPQKDYQKGLALFGKELYNEALQNWLAAANQGYPKAMCDVGWMFSQGYGHQKDEEEAFRWMLKAAEAGYVRAQNNVGLYYKNGTGCEKNLKECVAWLSKAEKAKYEKLAKKALKEARNELKAKSKPAITAAEEKRASGYLDTLRILLSGGSAHVNDAQRRMLAEMRRNQKISNEMHRRCLSKCGITEAEFDGGAKMETSAGPVRECVVCMDAPSEYIILDCMHVCLCEQCAEHAGITKRMKACPTCRKSIKEVRRAYMT